MTPRTVIDNEEIAADTPAAGCLTSGTDRLS